MLNRDKKNSAIIENLRLQKQWVTGYSQPKGENNSEKTPSTVIINERSKVKRNDRQHQSQSAECKEFIIPKYVQ